MPDSAPILRRLREILALSGDRVGKARRIAAAVRETGGFRWVGIYDVSADAIQVVAWSGPALSTTRSEIVTPILGGMGAVVGLLDVESDVPHAFRAEDRACLEACARLLSPLWA